MKNILENGAISLLALALLMPFFSGAQEKIPAEKWSIATGGAKDAMTLFTAGEFQTLLAKRIGKKLPVLTGKKLPSSPVILLGKTDQKLAFDGFRIQRKKNVITITGGSPIGALYGVYEFLQRYCDIWTVAPGVIYAPKGRLSFGKMDLTLAPAIEFRRLYHAGTDYTLPATRKNWNDFELRNRLNIVRWTLQPFAPHLSNKFRVSSASGRSCHSFYDFVPPKKYAKTHPEYFSLNESGVRDFRENGGGQLCFTNKDVERIVFDHLLRSIRKDRARYKTNYPLIYDFSQMDCSNFLCLCPECKKIIQKYGNKDAGLLLWFVNKIAKKIKPLYPDILIRTFAYVSTEHLPKGIKAEDNVMIQLCDLYPQSNHTLPLTHPINRKRAELTRGWGKIAKHLMIWDYILQDGKIPLVPVDAIAADARFYQKSNVKWIMMESEIAVSNPASFEHLKNFLIAQLYYNPDMNLDKLLDVYCKGMFGKAHKEMRAYLEILRKAQNSQPTANMFDWHNRNLKHITIPFLRTCLKKVEAAEKVNKDPVAALHILQEKNVLCNALDTMLKAYPKLVAERKKVTENLLNNRLKVLRSYGLIPQRLKKLEAEMRIPFEERFLVFTDLPEELKKFPPGSLHFLGTNRLRKWGKNAKFIKDPDSQMEKVISWNHPDKSKFTPRICFGIYDWIGKKAVATNLLGPKDEKYHWHKIVRFTMSANTIGYMLDWSAGINVQGFYVVSDGVKEEENPNNYELWLSVKFQGPAYKKGSTKPNAINIERGILVPVSKKYGNWQPKKGKK